MRDLSERALHRERMLDRLSQALRSDERLAGAVLVGSGATGFRDDESDIDMMAPVADGCDAGAVFEDWKKRVGPLLGVRYLADTLFTEQHHLLVLLCDKGLEVDLSFPSLENTVVLVPKWRILWDRSGDVARRMSVPGGAGSEAGAQTYIWALNRGVHRAIYASKALKRGELWKATLLLDELRCRTMQLACLNVFGSTYTELLGSDGVERHADQLPPEVLARFAATLPAGSDAGALGRSLAACTEILIEHGAVLDGRHGLQRAELLAGVLGVAFSAPSPESPSSSFLLEEG